MPRPPAYQRFFAELKRRKVFRVAAVYGATAFAVMEAADLVFPRIPLPDWTVTLVVWLAILGFPVVVGMAWVFERTDGEIRVTESASSEEIDAIVAEPATRRWPSGVAALAGVLLLALGAWTAWRVVVPDRPPLDEARLAVFPFGVTGATSLQWLDEGLPTLLSQNLMEPGETETVDPAQVFKVAAPGTGRALPVSEAGARARALGAGRFVVGTVQGAAGRVRIHASLYALRDSVHAIARGEVEGDTTALFDLVDRLTAELLGAGTEFGAASRDLVRSAGRTTGSLPALRAYLEGERHLRNGDIRDAGESFATAVERDSTFALAMYRKAFADLMWYEEESAAEWVHRALRHGEGLSAHEHQALDALDAYLDGRIADAERDYRALADAYPSRLDARVLLTILLAQYDPFRGRPGEEAVRMLREIRDADPGYLCLACLSGQIHLQDEDMAGLWEDQLDIMEAMPDSARNETFEAVARAVYALATGDTAAWNEARAGLLTTEHPDSVAWESVVTAVIYLGRPALADTLLTREFADADDPTDWPLFLDWMRGRWQDAYDRLDDFDDDDLGVLIRARAVDVPLAAAAPDARAAADRVLAYTGPTDDDDDRPELLPHLRLYGAALLRLQAGDPDSALHLADSLAALPAPEGAEPVVRNAIRTIRGEAALRAGDPHGARAQLDSLEWEFPPSVMPASRIIGARPYMLRGEAAWRDGDLDAARRWLEGIRANYHGDYSLVQLRRAQIHEELGDLELARLHYARVLEALEPADPELGPRVEEATRGLQALVGEGR
jgi:tetratricopeptide (TPR) repeat protein